MPWALLKRDVESLVEPAPIPTSKPCPKPRAKPRAKSLPIFRLYPQPEPESQRQAEILLREIQEHAADAIGQYVPWQDLERLYRDLCQRKSWTPKHWCVIGRELGKLVGKRTKKHGTTRFTAYLIPASL